MGRNKGNLNKNIVTMSPYSLLEPTERANLLANLIVDQIMEDQLNHQKLLKRITRQGYGKPVRN